MAGETSVRAGAGVVVMVVPPPEVFLMSTESSRYADPPPRASGPARCPDSIQDI
jgi:hypothetical protein